MGRRLDGLEELEHGFDPMLRSVSSMVLPVFFVETSSSLLSMGELCERRGSWSGDGWLFPFSILRR